MRGFLKRLFTNGKGEVISAKDWAFVLNTLGVSLLITAIIVTYAPYMDYDNPKIDEIRGVERSLQRVAPSDITALVKQTVEYEKKPVMLVMYASWCGYCAKQLPLIIQGMKTGELDGVKPLFVSMDTQARIFSKYLVKTGYYNYFAPYMLREAIYNNLPDTLKESGGHFTGSIPYIAILGKDAKLLAEFVGLVDKQTLFRAAQEAAVQQ